MMTFVTMAKLLPPPRKAKNRSGLENWVALTTVPLARTVSKATTVSHDHPKRWEKNEIPPCDLVSISPEHVQGNIPPRIEPVTPVKLFRVPVADMFLGSSSR